MNLSIFMSVNDIKSPKENIMQIQPKLYYVLSSDEEGAYTEGEIIYNDTGMYVSVCYKQDIDIENLEGFYIDYDDIENICINIVKNNTVLKFNKGIKAEEITDYTWFDTGEYYFATNIEY